MKELLTGGISLIKVTPHRFWNIIVPKDAPLKKVVLYGIIDTIPVAYGLKGIQSIQAGEMDGATLLASSLVLATIIRRAANIYIKKQ